MPSHCDRTFPHIPRPSPRRGVCLPAGFAILVVLFGIVGCSNNPYPPGDTARNTVYAVQNYDIVTLDPTVCYSANEPAIMDNIYESFYKYDHLKQNPVYQLDLALGAEEPTRTPLTFASSDLKTGKPIKVQGEEWTFRLKKGLRFQDDPCFAAGKGRVITATDILYSFRRMTDPTLACPVLSFFQDKIAGMDALVKHEAEQQKQKKPLDWQTYPCAGLIADPSDPCAFRIRLTMSYPQLRFLMAMHFTSPIPHEAVERYGEDYARHPVGCGSFMMGEYLPKQRLVLVKNPNRMAETYPTEGDAGDREAGLLDDAGKPLPMVDKIVFNYEKEPISIWNLFQQGYLDAAGVSQDNYGQAMARPGQLSPEMAARGIRLRDVSTPSTYYLGFNFKDPLWGGYGDRSRKLRQAVSLCIDRQEIVDVFQLGQGKVAQFVLPPGIFGYDPTYKNPYGLPDVDKAKRLLSEAGYPGGIDPATGQRIVLDLDASDSNGGATDRQFFQFLKNQIEQCGVHVNVQTWQSAIWQQRVDTGKASFFRWSWFADYPDPENFLFLFYGPNAGGVNHIFYDNPQYNRLFEQMRSMDNTPQRLAIIRRMRDLWTNDCPWICLYHSSGYSLSYDWLHDNKPHGVAYDGIRYVRVDGARRAALQRAWNQPNYTPIAVTLILLLLGSIPAVATVNARRNRSVRRRKHGGRATGAEATGERAA